MPKAAAYAASSATMPLAPLTIERRDPGPHDVQIDILYCGICHSDLHTVRNEWGGRTTYPCVPGHEIVGRVVKAGSHVKKFKEGDRVGVGCLVDSCRVCSNCKQGLEQYCDNGATYTYDAPDKVSGGITYGGYSTQMVVDENYVLRVPDKLDPAGAAPLMCAGITTYSPLRHWNTGKGKKVGIVGLGADEVVISKNPDEMKKHLGSFDFILNSVAASHDLNVYLELLKRDGTMCMLGVPAKPHPPVNVGNLIFRRRCLAGSLIGGIRETQEMLDFCAEHGIVSDIEIVPMQKVNEAYERLLKSDVKYRFVIDMASLKT